MLFILGIIAFLALFFTPTIADSNPPNGLTPAQIELGRVEGFHARPVYGRVGDYLLNTYCFCAMPKPVPEHYSEANYIQVEYYNFHQNTTYILSHLCLAYRDSELTCLMPRVGTGISFHNGVDSGRFCRSWYNHLDLPGLKAHDELCYELSSHDDFWRQYRLPGPDTLTFNGQKRRLDTLGRQGPLLWGRKIAEDRCEVMCKEHAGMPLVRGDGMAVPKIISWEDIDDMCVGCMR